MFDCDFLLAFPLSSWPSQAAEWRHRNRHWPDQTTVDMLTRLPCHVIPKPRHELDIDSWRFSFSRQELELAHEMPLNARLCYICVKLMFKKHIQIESPSILKSYHILTMFLWFMETRSVFVWKNDSQESFEENLRTYLNFLCTMLENKKIPHYFISSINLLENLLPHDDRNQLDKVAATIREMMGHKKFPR